MVTMLIVNIWEVLAIPQPCAEWNIVICHNVSEEISISRTSEGGEARAWEDGGSGGRPANIIWGLCEEGEEGEWLLEE